MVYTMIMVSKFSISEGEKKNTSGAAGLGGRLSEMKFRIQNIF